MNPSTFQQSGYAILPEVFSKAEVEAILTIVEAIGTENPNFRSAGGVFAIRRLLQEIPELETLVWNAKLRQIASEYAPLCRCSTKSIYFDKIPGSNWFVAWHQDISISVSLRAEVPGYSQWTQKQGIIGVVPPLEILEHTLTLRIHLDDTDESNGALRIVEGSHLWGIARKELTPWNPEKEIVCNVPAGGVMLMRPLTMHASRRAQVENPGRRRVIHIEICDQPLEPPLEWAEQRPLPL